MSTRLLTPLLVGLGALSATMLVAAALVDVGDPGAAILDGLEREAASHGQLVLQGWEDTRQRQAPVARASAEAFVPAPGGSLGKAPLDGGGIGSADQLRLIGGLSSLRRGAFDEADLTLRQLVMDGSALSGEALLKLVTVAELRESALADWEALAPSVPWDAAVDGTSGRLLALLSAAEDLSPNLRTQLAEELEEAINQRLVCLPPPVDSAAVVHVDRQRPDLHFEPDPWWSALAQRADTVLPFTAAGAESEGRWQRAFLWDERRARALGQLTREVSADGWHLTRALPGVWLAQKRVGAGDQDHGLSGVRLALHAEADLMDAIRNMRVSASGLVASAWGESSSRVRPAAMASLGPLPGTDLALEVSHPDPGSLAAGARSKVRALRYGLFAVAILLLGATILAARLVRRARGLSDLRSTFVASVSHDLRTPLASIGLMAENLSAGYAKGREEHYGTRIQRETRRLGRLVDDLLDFGRIERGLAPSVKRRDVEIAPWLEAFAGRERARCAASACALSLEVEGELGSASLDADALERALGNLIDNAMKHGAAKSIRLRAARSSQALLEIEVEDEGRGLPAGAVHEHLFEAFQRRSDVEGTGLGLTIVRAIAEAHGGSARLDIGAGGKGALATISIPTEPVDAA